MSVDAAAMRRIAHRAALRLEAIVKTQTVPVRTGELRQSLHTSPFAGGWLVGTNKIYARAVHDGRPAMVIRPKDRRALYWPGARRPVRKVVSPARKARPFLRQALDRFLSHAEAEIRRLRVDRDLAGVLCWALKRAGVRNLRVEG
ncbi:hypothetical protein [Pyramidobacter porci]